MFNLVLAFDIDHVLFESYFNKDDKSMLSSSVELKKTEDTTIDNPILKTDPVTNKDLRVDHVRSINRLEMADIFRSLVSTMLKAKEKKVTSPIAVKIITSSSYDKMHVLKLLDKFYFYGLSRLQDPDYISIDFYNVENLENLSTIPTPPGQKTRSGTIDPRKAALMSTMYPQWQKEMPNLKKQNVVLLDNADFNIAAVRSQGFKGLHYPTTPADRLDDISFTKHGNQALQELRELIAEAQKSIN